jgi:hypothetical protein
LVDDTEDCTLEVLAAEMSPRAEEEEETLVVLPAAASGLTLVVVMVELRAAEAEGSELNWPLPSSFTVILLRDSERLLDVEYEPLKLFLSTESLLLLPLLELAVEWYEGVEP